MMTEGEWGRDARLQVEPVKVAAGAPSWLTIVWGYHLIYVLVFGRSIGSLGVDDKVFVRRESVSIVGQAGCQFCLGKSHGVDGKQRIARSAIVLASGEHLVGARHPLIV